MKKKIVTWVTVCMFLFSQTGLAQIATNIATDGKTNTTVSNSGNGTYNINTDTVHGNTGFNTFKKFDLGAGDTANLHLANNTANLVNMVTGNSKSFIDGTMNAYKNGKIGGNVFFLNPNGIMVGATGIINVGAITLAAPTQEFMDSVLGEISGGNLQVNNFINAVSAGDIPINPSGNISIKGKVNAYYGANIHSAKVNIEGANAQINTLNAINPADIVNLQGVPDSVDIVKDGKGKILITAKNINIDGGAKIRAVRDQSLHDDKYGNVEIKAYDTGVVPDTFYLYDKDGKIGSDDKEGGRLIANREASINIGNAEIIGNDVTIEAKAVNDYDHSSYLMDLLKDALASNYSSLVDDQSDIFTKLGAIGFERWYKVFDDVDLHGLNGLNFLLMGTSLLSLIGQNKSLFDGGVSASSTKAVVSIGDSASIKAEKNLNILATTTSRSMFKSDAKFMGASYGLNDAYSEVNIGKSLLEAGNDVKINAVANTISEMENKIDTKGKNEKDKTIEDMPFGMGAAISIVTNSAVIKSEADISAGNNVEIKSASNKDIAVSAEAKAGSDTGLVASGVLNVSKTDNVIEISGNISAGEKIDILSIIDTAQYDAKGERKEGKNASSVKAADIERKEKDAEGNETGNTLPIDSVSLALSYYTNEDKSNIKISDASISSNRNDININSKINIPATSSKTEATGISIAYSDNNINSSVDIVNSKIKGAGDIKIASEIKLVSNVETNVRPVDYYDDLSGNIGVILSKNNTNNFVSLSEDTEIESAKDATVSAVTKKDISSTAKAISPNASNLGIAFVSAESISKNDVIGNNVKINADNINIISEIENSNSNLQISVLNGRNEYSYDPPTLKKDIEKILKQGNDVYLKWVNDFYNPTYEPPVGVDKLSLHDKFGNLFERFQLWGLEQLGGLVKNKGYSWLEGIDTFKNFAKIVDLGYLFETKLESFNIYNSYNDPENDGNKGFSAAAGAYLNYDNSAVIKLFSLSLNAANDINSSAKVSELSLKNDIEAVIKSTPDYSGTGAVLYSDYSAKANILIENSSLDAGQNINITSEQKIPIKDKKGTWLDDLYFQKEGISKIPEMIMPTVNEMVFRQIEEATEDLAGDFLNTWVRSVSVEGDDSDGGKLSIAGSVSIGNYDLGSNVQITNSKINQKEDKRTGNQKVNINAVSDNALVNVGGIIGDEYQTIGGQKSGAAGLGGVYNQVTYNTNTKAYIDGIETEIYADDLALNSLFQQQDITVGVAGGQSDSFAFEGAVNWVKSENNVEAYIADAKKVEIGEGGNLDLSAKNNSLFINIAGSEAFSGKTGVGMSGAVTEAVRKTNAYMSNIKNIKTGNIDISALNAGIIYVFSVAAVKSAKESVKKPVPSEMPYTKGYVIGGA